LQPIRFLPKTGEPFLLAVILILVAGCLTLGVLPLRALLAHPEGVSLLGTADLTGWSVFWFALATGLWLLRPTARPVAMATLCVVVLLAPFVIRQGLLPVMPEQIKDGTVEVTRLEVALWILSVIVPVLLALYVLHKHKTQFRS
jgi:hypothetical protein